jgi:hypothetical protein
MPEHNSDAEDIQVVLSYLMRYSGQDAELRFEHYLEAGHALRRMEDRLEQAKGESECTG